MTKSKKKWGIPCWRHPMASRVSWPPGQAEALVRNLGGFARFLPLATLFHGQVLSIAALARDTGISRTTVQGYIEILEDTLLAYRLPAFEGGLRVREKKHAKFYWIDPGLVQAFSHDIIRINLRRNIRSKGCLFEGWVASTLRAYRDYRKIFDEIYYWSPADAQKTEVDFLLQKKNEFIAIEVKASERLRPEDFLGLKAIANLKGLKRRLIICLVDKPQKTTDGIEILPAHNFLSLSPRWERVRVRGPRRLLYSQTLLLYFVISERVPLYWDRRPCDWTGSSYLRTCFLSL